MAAFSLPLGAALQYTLGSGLYSSTKVLRIVLHPSVAVCMAFTVSPYVSLLDTFRSALCSTWENKVLKYYGTKLSTKPNCIRKTI